MKLRLIAVVLTGLVAAGAMADDWRPDEWITTKTAIALYAIPEVDPAGISVKSQDGQVTLIGAVPTADAQQKIVQAVRQIKGVQSVSDQLQVSAPPPAPEPRHVPGTDELRGEIVKKLSDDPELRDNSISVGAERGGVVVLGGFASSLNDQLRALRIARGTTGVQMVRNEMKSPPDTLYDLNAGEGAAQGADTRNRRERQALDGTAAEPPPRAGDAPPAEAGKEHPAAINPEGDTTHSPHTAD